tara:strand:- start:534 stop:1019 length:486 start_codon:yes stop_codon:yes gene_type:complete
MEVLNIQATSINPKLNTEIKNFVYKNKDKWQKNLKNVKALTSGFKPKYKFFDKLYNFSYKYIKKYTSTKFKRSCWWVNYYSKTDFCEPHNHRPDALSSILIVKSSTQNPLYFIDNNKKYIIEEKDGMLLFFNSLCVHGVEKCNDERITCTLDFIVNDSRKK